MSLNILKIEQSKATGKFGVSFNGSFGTSELYVQGVLYVTEEEFSQSTVAELKLLTEKRISDRLVTLDTIGVTTMSLNPDGLYKVAFQGKYFDGEETEATLSGHIFVSQDVFESFKMEDIRGEISSRILKNFRKDVV